MALIMASSPSTTHSSPTPTLEVQRLSTVKTGATLLGVSHLELGLLDHYCNIVAPVISARNDSSRMWQYEIPHQAKAHPYLMHTILSTSAYHLCCAYARPLRWQEEQKQALPPAHGESLLVHPSQPLPQRPTEWQMRQTTRYERCALEQQRLAFQSYIPSVHAMGRHNEEALCAASALLSLNALASTQNRYSLPGIQTRYSSPIDDWLEISVLVRGVDTVVINASTNLPEGVLGPLLLYRRIEASSDAKESDFQQQITQQVRQLVSPHVLSALDALAPAIDHCASSEADKDILQTALGLLKAAFAVAVVNPEQEVCVMIWSNMLNEQYFPLVKRREPMSLILLAYWTVSCQTFQDRWWVGGLGTTILRHIAEHLMSLEEKDEGVRDGNTPEGDYTLTAGLLKRSSEGVKDPATGKAKWRELLAWPLRESGIHDL